MVYVQAKDYFDTAKERAISANSIPYREWLESRENYCHANCEAFVQNFPEYEIVRGWLVNDGQWFMPHSVVRLKASGELIDITPLPEGISIPFIEHPGTEEEFTMLRQGRDGGYLHPPLTEIPDGPTIAEYG